MKLTLNVYDEKGEVKKICEAQTVDLEFGTVRSLMKVLNVDKMDDSMELLFYLCPERRISFDGFVNYEGHRFGVPYTYSGKTARVMRDADQLYIYSADLTRLLAAHDVTWSRYDSFCKDQYALPEQPEEYPSMPVKTVIKQLPSPPPDLSFEKFNFSKEDDWDD